MTIAEHDTFAAQVAGALGRPVFAPDLEQLVVPAGELVTLPGNPRKGSVEAVMRSLAAFGQQKPIVVNRPDNVVVAGNHTLAAARALEWDRVAVSWVDMEPATAKAFALADNRTADLATYDTELLAEMLEAIADDQQLMAASSWTQAELARMVADLDVEIYDDTHQTRGADAYEHGSIRAITLLYTPDEHREFIELADRRLEPDSTYSALILGMLRGS